ncbi:substrate-binding domain-containing protein [Paraburkholderia unamae]|uniref:Substrate-binding domain-containing protein n=1 Tax=Paraburkholderia unamae TaxID=219649 RepID=A0ACC6RB88_9BURK
MREASRVATRHLLALGHKRLAYLGFAFDEYHGVTERLYGYRDAMREFGLGLEAERVGFANFNAQSGYDAMNAMLEHGPTFTALFAGNDTVAFGAMAALRKAGLLAAPESDRRSPDAAFAALVYSARTSMAGESHRARAVRSSSCSSVTQSTVCLDGVLPNALGRAANFLQQIANRRRSCLVPTGFASPVARSRSPDQSPMICREYEVSREPVDIPMVNSCTHPPLHNE